MTQPIHTPSNWIFGQSKSYITAIYSTDKRRKDPICFMGMETSDGGDDFKNSKEHARLICAAVNGVRAAAAKLGCNAVELAERMQRGGISELVESLTEILADAEGYARTHGTGISAGNRIRQRCDRSRAILAKVKAGVA